jgi:hypothetical protein
LEGVQSVSYERLYIHGARSVEEAPGGVENMLARIPVVSLYHKFFVTKALPMMELMSADQFCMIEVLDQ